jgi:hypothetical protein
MAIASPISKSDSKFFPAKAPNGLFPDRFDWPLAFQAEQLVRNHISDFLSKNSFARTLADRMSGESGTDFFEWVDHLIVSPCAESDLRKAGFVLDQEHTGPGGEKVYEYVQATLPRILVSKSASDETLTLALRPEFVADFVAAHNLVATIQGDTLSRYRTVEVHREAGTLLTAVERRAWRGFVSAEISPEAQASVLKARELWQIRPRRFNQDSAGVKQAFQTLEAVLKLVDRDLACSLFFEEERAYWEKRNLAAQIQKRRQDRLGLGWGNHDHHTFRCSREHFVDLNEFLLRLGFFKRERYYAGAEAGWGAQISEQPTAGIVVFADVDLMPDETQLDFSVQKLPPAQKFGTVGLWVALHGESFLQAGMHHLEARFNFDLLRDQLKNCGVTTMKPFSDFKFLRQAFTEGERWPVSQDRLERLRHDGSITQTQFETFSREGAIGSHLENLERHGGFKGFNQKSVSAVISATDPRKDHFKTDLAQV